MLAILYIICMNIHQNLALERNEAYNGVIPKWQSEENRNRVSATTIQVGLLVLLSKELIMLSHNEEKYPIQLKLV